MEGDGLTAEFVRQKCVYNHNGVEVNRAVRQVLDTLTKAVVPLANAGIC